MFATMTQVFPRWEKGEMRIETYRHEGILVPIFRKNFLLFTEGLFLCCTHHKQWKKSAVSQPFLLISSEAVFMLIALYHMLSRVALFFSSIFITLSLSHTWNTFRYMSHHLERFGVHKGLSREQNSFYVAYAQGFFCLQRHLILFYHARRKNTRIASRSK